MTVCVYGLWHLGVVTAACLASVGHDVTGLDPDPEVVRRLSNGAPPVFEPGLDDLVKKGLAEGRLRFSADPAGVVPAADVVWIAIDTPVDEDDRADVEAVVRSVAGLFPHVRDGALMIVSSQLPVGTVARLERLFSEEGRGRNLRVACLPENLRLGSAIEVFTRPDRVVVGTRTDEDRGIIEALLRPFTDRFVWMSVESAEMTKHALNAFLATSVVFINELAAICETVGADASDVARGLKSDVRIGPRAYLSPGGAFAGGTLARDIMFLSSMGQTRRVAVPLLAAVKTSNDGHRRWAERRLTDLAGDLRGSVIAVWGLTYKPGTDTLRRSSAIELCEWLTARGASVQAHDPAVKTLPAPLAGRIALTDDPLAALARATAVVVATPWPEYRQIDAGEVAGRMPNGLVIDAGGFLAETLGRRRDLRYVRVGRALS